MGHKFQINLRGLIELLSNHLYSGPEVFVRELLQNGVDAIRARSYIDPAHLGEITLEILHPEGKPPTVVFTDNGVGLTEDEIHRFLATIGESSKRKENWDRPTDFIGQFGIGLLSCFVVSNEIVVITRSFKDQTSPTMEWRGQPDGTYSIKTLAGEGFSFGTQVFLTCKPGSEEHFDAGRVTDLVKHYGGLLPYPIKVVANRQSMIANADGAPWRNTYPGPKARTRTLLEYGRNVFETKFFDAIPLKSRAGDIDGVAFVLPYTPSLATKRTHKVYLKNMLLSEKADNLLPEWAFFVKAIVNANDLRPTASREGFYEDERLEAARVTLGECLKSYLVELAESDRDKLHRLIDLHALSIKSLAVHDDDFYRLFINWLPFETSRGEMTLPEYREENEVIRYVPTLDQFRQMSQVASAQDLTIINGGFVHDSSLLAKYPEVFPDASTEVIDAQGLLQTFDDLTAEEDQSCRLLLDTADEVLRAFRTDADIKKFSPTELPSLYSTSAEGRFRRSVEQTKDIASPLWGGVLDNIDKPGRGGAALATLCFNLRNPLVHRLAGLTDKTLLRRSVQMLYVQALLMGHHPLSSKEMTLLNEGLLAMIEWGVGRE